MPNRIARDVAEASRVTHEARTRKPRVSNTDVLVDIARQLERLQAKRRKMRRELRNVELDIKRVKREMKALAAVVAGTDEL